MYPSKFIKITQQFAYLLELRVFMFVKDEGTSRIVNCSDLVGVTTVVVQPCQELLSSLIKLLRLPLVSLFEGATVGAAAGGRGTTNPSFSIVSSLLMQFSDSKSSVNILVVVGVRTDVVEAVSDTPTNDVRLTFCVF